MATEKSALEKLAQEELERRDNEAFREMLKPVQEQQQKQQQQSSEWTRRVNEVMQQKADEKKAADEARKAAKAEAEAAKPEEIHQSYVDLLHRTMDRVSGD